MSRPLRIAFPGATYHITVRGNEKKDIYFCDADRRLFLRILDRTIHTHHWICHAYCLMGNHYHLLIETPDGNLSEGMRQLNGTYAQKINERYRRVGHLFQGRFKAFLIENIFYLVTVARYIVLNPVRAGIVKEPAAYDWSSFRQTAGLARKRNFLTISDILIRFSTNQMLAQKRYLDFVLEKIPPLSPFKEARHQILGSEQFIFEAENWQVDDIGEEIPREQRMIGRPNLEDMFSRRLKRDERNSVIRFAVEQCGYSQSVVARHLHLHYSTVFRVLKMHRFKT